MDLNQRRALRQRLTRQERIKQAEGTPYSNRYGMTPAQIHKALKNKPSSQTRHIERRPRKPSTRPQKLSRSRNNQNKSLLLEVPNVSTQPAVVYPTPKWFTTTEKMEVSVIVPMYKSASVVRDLVASWDLSERLRVEVLFVDDNCPHNSKSHLMDCWAKRQQELKRPVGKVIYSSHNQGFGTACNIGARYATGDYLIFLNADTIVTPQWIWPIVRMLRKPEVGIVGNLQLHQLNGKETVHSAGSQWDWQAGVFRHIGKEIYNHVLIQRPFLIDNAPKDIFKSQEREMVTGACLGIRKELFDDLGGFNPNYRIGYWEDSDLCMTVREKGYKVMYQPASKIYHKGSHSGAGGHKYAHHNTNYFKNKWINSGRIDSLVDAPRPEPLAEVGNIVLKRTSAHGDALMAAAVAAGLKKKYPRCKVMFNTACPEVAEKSPYIDKVIKAYELSERTFQLFYNLDMAYEFRPKSNVLQAYADVVGVDINDCELFLNTEEVEGLPKDYIVIHAGNTHWAGRDWSPLRFEVLANKLLKQGYQTVVVGSGRDHHVSATKDLVGRTTIHELAYVIKNAHMFVGIDSFPMHVAQTFNIPGVVFFGSIDPRTRLIRDNIRVVRVEGLPCLGCHHRQPTPCTVTAHCETGTKECVNGISIETMHRNIEEVWKKTKSTTV